MRLVELRGFIDGHGWFDLHEPRLGPPEGYDTHWSRLIDAGLAGLLWLFGLFTDPAMAERLMRVVWPMLWLLPTMAGATAIAWRVAGRDAAPIALVLTAVGLPAFAHFVPGRIDHHNVQIALAVLLVAAVAWSDRKRWAAAAAGALTGAAMAIGFEGLPYIVLAGVALALRFICAPATATAPSSVMVSGRAGSVAAAFLVSVGPAQWGHTACDAIAINSAVAADRRDARACACRPPSCAGGLAGPGRRRRRRRPGRRGGLRRHRAALPRRPLRHDGPDGACAVVQQCLGDAVAVGGRAGIAAGRGRGRRLPGGRPPALALIARDPATRRDFGFPRRRRRAGDRGRGHVLDGARLQLRHLAGDPDGRGRRGAPVPARCGSGTLAARTLVALLLTPAVTAAVAMAAVQAVTARPPRAGEFPRRRRLPARRSYAQLAALPPGLVATDIDYGPFVLALTPHAVMSAPYHRLVGPIIAAHEIFALPPDAARQVAAAAKPDYLAVCGRHTLGHIGEAARDASLWGRLAAGDVPPWLERVEDTRRRTVRGLPRQALAAAAFGAC